MLYLSPVLPLDFLSSHSPIFSLLFVFLIALVDLVGGANSSSIYIHSTW